MTVNAQINPWLAAATPTTTSSTDGTSGDPANPSASSAGSAPPAATTPSTQATGAPASQAHPQASQSFPLRFKEGASTGAAGGQGSSADLDDAAGAQGCNIAGAPRTGAGATGWAVLLLVLALRRGRASSARRPQGAGGSVQM
jgi:hypothetical protein